MSALPDFASQADRARQRAEDQAEARQQAENDALEAMQGTPGKVEDFLTETGADASVLLALLFTDGLPLRDKSERDDRQILRVSRQIESLQAQFNAWAQRPTYGLTTSPLKRWMEDVA